MNHPENKTRVLLTPYILGNELARLCKGNDWFADLRESAGGRVKLIVGCNGKTPVPVEFEAADLLMSLDDFSAKHIAPLVPLFKVQ